MRELGAFIHDAANAFRKAARMHAIENHFRDRFLAFDALAARFVVHRFRQAILLRQNLRQCQIARRRRIDQHG
jgi:hypothetical protein